MENLRGSRSVKKRLKSTYNGQPFLIYSAMEGSVGSQEKAPAGQGWAVGTQDKSVPPPPETGPASPDSWSVAVGPWAMASGCPRATSPYHPRSPRQPRDIALVVNLQLVTGVWRLGRSSESPTSSPPGGAQTRAGSLEPKAGEGGRWTQTVERKFPARWSSIRCPMRSMDVGVFGEGDGRFLFVF